MQTSFKQKLLTRRPLYGTLITTGSTEVADCLADCGFDWLFLDMEHGSIEPSMAQRLLQTIGSRCSGVIRIPENSPAWFKRALDSGAEGVIVPLVTTADEARAAVALAKYPPIGTRSVGIGRAQGYGKHFTSYVESANENIALIIQVEHIKAVENLDAILEVDGIDAAFIGPYDLSGSMGMLGKVQEPQVLKVISVVREKCSKKGLPVGAFALKPETALKDLAAGCRFVAVGIDTCFLWNSATEALRIIRGDYIPST